MADIDSGDSNCTTGLSKAIFDQLVADTRSGIPFDYKQGSMVEIKARCYAVALGVANQINAGGGLGGGSSTPSGPTAAGARRTQRLFDVQPSGTQFSSYLGGNLWQYTNGGGVTLATFPNDQAASCFYVKQNTTSTFHAPLNSSSYRVVYAKRRPKLIVSAKFGTYDSTDNCIGWGYDSTGGSQTWANVLFSNPGFAYAKFYILKGGANWIARIGDGTTNSFAAVPTSILPVPKNDGKWHTFVIDYSDASKVDFYVDGNQVASLTSGLPSDPNNYGAFVSIDNIYNSGGVGANGAETWIASIDLENAYPMNV